MKYINNVNKLNEIKLKDDNYYIVIDFDKTITANNSVDSWYASGMFLSKEYKERADELYKKYRPIEKSYTISIKEKEKAMIEWYSKNMDLYMEYGLTKEKIEKAVYEEGLILRKGVKDFLYKAYEKNIPVIILSAGIGNIIVQFLKANNCYFDNMYIISNFIDFDDYGNMKKFDNSKMIHTLNKTIKFHLSKEFEEKIKHRKYRLLYGDLIEDLKMVEPEELCNTITIGFLCELDENIEVYNKNFDVVLTRG